MEEKNVKLSFVQVITIIGESYGFKEPDSVGYHADSEMYFVKVGSDETLFPREAVIAFRVVEDTEEAKIVDIFGNANEEENDD